MKRAFTLVEMLAATALAAMLMVAVLLVVVSLRDGQKQLARQTLAADPSPLLNMVRWDVLNSRKFHQSKNLLILSGYDSLDRNTLSDSGHRPVQVIYRLQQAGGQQWLTRTQQTIEADHAAGQWTELVAGGIVGFSIGPANAPPAAATALKPKARTEFSPTPDTVRIVIQWQSANRPDINRIFQLR